MKTPFFSVIMPVFNAETHLSEAISSILQQDFTDFEFIIIDDGSTDKSQQIISSFQDPRIRLLVNYENKGISYSLNRAILESNAPYIARMDADDISLPHRLSSQYSFIIQHPGGAIYSSSVEEISQDGASLGYFIKNPLHYYFNQVISNWIYHPTVIFDKMKIMALGMYPTENAEDYILFSKAYKQYKIYHQPEVLLKYRYHRNSISQATGEKQNMESHLKQVLENIQYYLPTRVSLPSSEIVYYFAHPREFRFHHANLSTIVKGDLFLKKLSGWVVGKSNPNNVPFYTSQASMIQRQFLITHYLSNYPILTKMLILIRTQHFELLRLLIRGKLTRILSFK